MSTRKFQLHISGFKSGLNTEASALNVLPSELMDGSINVELLQNGELRRRRGVDFVGESIVGGFLQQLRASTKILEDRHESPSAVYVKLTAPNGSTIERVVVDMNDRFLIYKTDKESLSNIDTPHQTLIRSWVAFGTTVTKSVDDQKFYNMQFEQSGNRLFFTGLKCHPGYLSVSATDNDSLVINFIDVLIRDPDNQTANTRRENPTASKVWYECIEAHTSSVINEPGVGDEWTRYWFKGDGEVNPGPAEVDWATSTAYTSTFIKRYDKFVDTTSTDTYPTAIDFYAGRVWLSGDPKFPNDILFSQVFINDGDLEKFHQYADPFDNATNPDADLVADDGGVISLQGAGLVKDITDIGSSIFIGSTQGVWQIKGQDAIFKATSFSSDKVLTEPIPGPGSMLQADTSIFVFGENNIWRADFANTSGSTATGLADFENFSDNRLETLYSNIPINDKASAWSVYNPTDRKIYYFFNRASTQFSLSYGSKVQPGYFTNALVMDVRQAPKTIDTTVDQLDAQRVLIGAFYLYSFADTGHNGQPYIAFPFVAPDIGIANNRVIASGNEVTAASGVNDVVAVGGTEAGSAIFFIALQRANPAGETININNAFGRLESATITDWTSDATYKISFNSIVITGFQTMGDVLHKKAATYLFFLFNRTETGTLVNGVDTNQGGCFVRTAWNWAANTNSPLYSDQHQVYRPDRWGLSLTTGAKTHSHVWWKHRVRGRGNALQVIFENEGDKDFHLIGWSQQFHGKID